MYNIRIMIVTRPYTELIIGEGIYGNNSMYVIRSNDIQNQPYGIILHFRNVQIFLMKLRFF